VRCEYQPERKRKHGSTVFIPKYKKNGNINPDGFRGNFVKRQGANPDKFGPNEVLLGLSLIK
jgi:hypothetical protein